MSVAQCNAIQCSAVQCMAVRLNSNPNHNQSTCSSANSQSLVCRSVTARMKSTLFSYHSCHLLIVIYPIPSCSCQNFRAKVQEPTLSSISVLEEASRMLCWLQDSALACSIVIAYLTNLLRKVLKATKVRDESSIRLSMLCCAVVFLDFVGVAYDTALDRGRRHIEIQTCACCFGVSLIILDLHIGISRTESILSFDQKRKRVDLLYLGSCSFRFFVNDSIWTSQTLESRIATSEHQSIRRSTSCIFCSCQQTSQSSLVRDLNHKQP